MKQIYASILLIVFTGFLVSISTDFGLYMKILNAGSLVEDVNSMPEEHNEKSGSDSKLKNHLTPGELLLLSTSASDDKYFHNHQFSLVENIYFDVPYPPPEIV